MNMNIANVYRADNVYNSYRSTTGVSRVSRAEEKKDMVELSSRAKDCQIALGALAKMPDVRAEKIAEIRAQMQAGTYNVSAHMVADKILDAAAATLKSLD